MRSLEGDGENVDRDADKVQEWEEEETEVQGTTLKEEGLDLWRGGGMIRRYSSEHGMVQEQEDQDGHAAGQNGRHEPGGD